MFSASLRDRPGSTPSVNLLDGLPPAGGAYLQPAVSTSGIPVAPRSARELERLLASERARAEQHKAQYGTLRTEFTRLQEEHLKLQQSYEGLIDEKRLADERYRELIEQFKSESAELQARISELKSQLITPQRLELLRMEVSDELQRAFEERAAQLEAELSAAKQDASKLRYEVRFLQSELERAQSEHGSQIEQIRLQNEAEVTNLRKERETMLANRQSEFDEDAKRLKTMQKELANAQLRVRALQSELEETQAIAQTSSSRLEGAERTFERERADLQASVKQAAIEREALRAQLDAAQKEIAAIHEDNSALARRAHSQESEVVRLRTRVTELEHEAKLADSNAQIAALKCRQDLERDLERRLRDVDSVKREAVLANERVRELEAQLAAQDDDSARKLQSVRDTEWTRQRELESEKIELEQRVASLERSGNENESRFAERRTQMESELRAANDLRAQLERECSALKERLRTASEQDERARAAQRAAHDAKRRCAELEGELQAALAEHVEALELNAALESDRQRLVSELAALKDSSAKHTAELSRFVKEKEGQFDAERAKLNAEIDALSRRVAERNERAEQRSKTLSDKVKRYAAAIKQLQTRTKLADGKLEQARLELAAMQRASVPVEMHNQTKRHLRDLFKRHSEFRSLILGTNPTDPRLAALASAPLAATASGGFDMPTIEALLAAENEHERELSLLRERLDNMNRAQREQLDTFEESLKLNPSFAKRGGLKSTGVSDLGSSQQRRFGDEQERDQEEE